MCVCMHVAYLLWQLLVFAFECLEGGARTERVTKEKGLEKEGEQGTRAVTWWG